MRSSHIDRMLERLEDRVKPTKAQKAAFADFRTAAKIAADKVRASCPIEQPRFDALSWPAVLRRAYFFAAAARRSPHARPTPQFVSFEPGTLV
jgi:hypothetical protein